MATEQLRILRVDGRVTGMEKVTGELGKVAVATVAVGKATSELDQVQQRYLARAALRQAVDQAAAKQYIMTTQAAQQYARSVAALNENTENGRSFLNDIDLASTVNHLKQAAIAAYALSPAFRQLVNPAITASIRALGPVAVAAGGAAFSALSPVLALASRIALPITLAVESFRAMNAITELGAQKMEELTKLAERAAGAGVSTGFFQQQAAGAKTFSISADQATDALKRFNDVSREQLGGSAFSQRLSELTKAGNFSGNPGVAALQRATDTEGRYRAVIELISVAADRGERLAALDLASRFLPPEMLERLRGSASFLKDMQAAADATRPAKIIGAEDIGYALELKRRLDDANEVIANKFKPVQKDLTQLGLNYQESWVNITELMAGAVTKGNDLYTALKGVPGLFAQAGNASFWTKLTDYTGKLGLNSDSGLILKGEPGFLEDPARRSLAAGLRNPSAVQDWMKQGTAVQSSVRGDVSANPTAAAKADANDRVDAAINTLRRHVEQQDADTRAMGLGAEALARFRAEAAQTSAVQANGGKITAEQAAQFEILKNRAGEAALALEKAKISDQLRFGRSTAFLSAEDVQIASQLRGIFPDVTQALGSSEAAAMRLNNTLRDMSTTGQDLNRSFLVDFTSGIRNGANAFEAFRTAGVNALGKIADKLASMAADNLWSGAFGGSTGGGLFSFLGLGGGGSMPVMSGTGLGSGTGGLSFPMFANGTNSAPGGPAIINERGGEIVNLPSGAQVIPHDISMRMAAAASNDNSSVSAPVTIQIDATGADAAGLARVSQQLARLEAELPSRIVATVKKARGGRIL